MPRFLLTSPLVGGVLKTAEYFAANGGISLTISGAFNRKFVHWAATEFDWPGYSEVELFSIYKFHNEWDVPPVGDIHALLNGLKFARHYKGKILLTKSGKELVKQPARLLSELGRNFLFRLDNGAHMRAEDQVPGNWGIFHNVINVEADHGTSRSALRKTLYGDPETSDSFHVSIASNLNVTVRRPLCWTGLLKEEEPHRPLSDARFTKTELWRRTLRLHADTQLRPRVVHCMRKAV